jgi:hypothetical protein
MSNFGVSTKKKRRLLFWETVGEKHCNPKLIELDTRNPFGFKYAKDILRVVSIFHGSPPLLQPNSFLFTNLQFALNLRTILLLVNSGDSASWNSNPKPKVSNCFCFFFKFLIFFSQKGARCTHFYTTRRRRKN